MLSLSHIKTGLSSMVFNFYHLGASRIPAWAARLDKTYHQEQASYYCSKGWNSFYKLIGSKRRFMVIAPLLVKTQNHLVPELDNKEGWQKIVEKTQNLLENQQTTCLKPPQEPSLDNLSGGCCLGIVEVFIRDYHQARSQGLAFREAAMKAAKLFEKGAPLLAAAMQHIHRHSEVDLAEFDKISTKRDITKGAHSLMRRSASVPCVSTLLGAKSTVFDMVSLDGGERNLGALKDGSYFIGIGGKVTSDKEGTRRFVQDKGHAVALLVNQKSYLIFDPEIGLFSHPEPTFFFEELDSNFPGNGTGLLVCYEIRY